MSEHTPGPWSWYDGWEHEGRIFSVRLAPKDAFDEGILIGTSTGEIEIRNEADAHLIAAAPDLLEALLLPYPMGAYLRCRESGDSSAADELHEYEAKVQAAIAKARGQGPKREVEE